MKILFAVLTLFVMIDKATTQYYPVPQSQPFPPIQYHWSQPPNANDRYFKYVQSNIRLTAQDIQAIQQGYSLRINSGGFFGWNASGPLGNGLYLYQGYIVNRTQYDNLLSSP